MVKKQDVQYTKYERARLVGSRALQLSMGAPMLIKLSAKELESINYNPVEIAKRELEAGVIPMDVVRPKPRVIGKDAE